MLRMIALFQIVLKKQHCTRQEESTNDWSLEIRISEPKSMRVFINS